jgi:hypothetical protein
MGASNAGVNNSGRLIYLDSTTVFCANGTATARLWYRDFGSLIANHRRVKIAVATRNQHWGGNQCPESSLYLAPLRR